MMKNMRLRAPAYRQAGARNIPKMTSIRNPEGKTSLRLFSGATVGKRQIFPASLSLVFRTGQAVFAGDFDLATVCLAEHLENGAERTPHNFRDIRP